MTDTITFMPLLPAAFLLAIAALIAVLALAVIFRRRRSYIWRILFLGVVLIVLLQPSWQQQMRKDLPDKVLVLVDESSSQKIDNRPARIERALKNIETRLAKYPSMQPVIIRTDGQAGELARQDGTNLFAALKENMARLPLPQMAGVILVTDGQIADVPKDLSAFKSLGPLNTVLTGRRDETDRRLSITAAPRYGVLNAKAVLRVRADAFGEDSTAALPVTALQDGLEIDRFTLKPGEEREVSVTLGHPGQNVISFSVPAVEGELTSANNQAVAVIEAIRDRMQVLLISGAPHEGERVWRNLLKSDPSIDLIHFTILRPPAALDPTPPEELALIQFPVDELFERKVNEFDLIILDRYREYGLLQQSYFDNIQKRVKNGGALLLAMGTDMPDTELFHTGLERLLPVALAGGMPEIINKPFVPALTAAGRDHPLTAELADIQQKAPWSNWYNQVPVMANADETVLSGANDQPLLVLRQAEKGRVAVLTSDNIWLWSKSDGRGQPRGPYAQMLRQLIHWLTREPDLEKGYIKTATRDHEITVSRRSGGQDTVPSVKMTSPDGTEKDVALAAVKNGWQVATVTGESEGLYRFSSGGRIAYAVIGSAASVEYTELQSTADKLWPAAAATGGGLAWQSDDPAIVTGRGDGDNDEKIHLHSKSPYAVTDIRVHKLIPDAAALFLLLAAMLLCWWKESR